MPKKSAKKAPKMRPDAAEIAYRVMQEAGLARNGWMRSYYSPRTTTDLDGVA